MKIVRLTPPAHLEPDVVTVDQKGNPCALAHPSSVYWGEATSTRGRRYYFWTRDEMCGATREEACGRIVRSVTPPPALRAAIRLALAGHVSDLITR